MLHVPAAVFAAATAAATPPPPPLRAWEYLRLRREAAGLSIDDVATALSPRIALRSGVAAMIRMLESPGARATHNRPIVHLARVFPLDVSVYRQLVVEPADRHPPVCRGCGCSYWDPCPGDVLGSVSRAAPSICTRCDAKAEAA